MQQVLEEHSRENDSRKRKRGEVEHNPDLSEAAATESVSSQTEAGTEEFTVQPVKQQRPILLHISTINRNDLTVDPFTTIASQEPNKRHHIFDFADSPKRILCGYLLHNLRALSFKEHLGGNGKIMALKEDFGEMEHRILELERQQVALKEQRDAAYQNICE
ncbi:unnamed protein product, partial [Brassica oleracea var. botrytis]